MKIRFRLREHLRRLWAATLAALVAEDPCEHDLYRWITCDCPGCGRRIQGRAPLSVLEAIALSQHWAIWQVRGGVTLYLCDRCIRCGHLPCAETGRAVRSYLCPN